MVFCDPLTSQSVESSSLTEKVLRAPALRKLTDPIKIPDKSVSDELSQSHPSCYGK